MNKKEVSLFDIIKKASKKKEHQWETLYKLIEEEISSAVPITFDSLAALNSSDKGNFVISIDRDTKFDFNPKIVLNGKKTTLTIKGSGNLGSSVEDVTFPGGKNPLFKIGEGAVLILENIAIRTKRLIRMINGCVVQLNGGILVFKHSVIINECYMGGSNQNIFNTPPNFTPGERITGMYCDIVTGDSKSIVYC